MIAFILAAGYGTRLKPITNQIPKALVKINDTPLLEILINKLRKYGFEKIIINVHYLAEQIFDFLNQKKFSDLKIIISDERQKILDTGGAVKKIAFCLNEPVLIHNVDIISSLNLKKFTDFFYEQKPAALLAVRKRNSSRILRFSQQNICSWIDKKNNKILDKTNEQCSNYQDFAFSGIQIVSPEIFKFFPNEDVFSIIKLYFNAAKNNHKILAYDHSSDFWSDVGTLEALEKVKNTPLNLIQN